MKIDMLPHSNNGSEINLRYSDEFSKYLKKGVVRDENSIDLISEKIKKISGFKNCVMVSSGTTALKLLIKSLNLRRGSTVITSPLTYSATVTAALENGLKVKFCDIDPKTLQMSGKSIENLLDDSVSLIIRVHINGNYCDLSEIQEDIRRKNIIMIDDSAQLFPINNTEKESFSNYCCFSLGPTKNIAGIFEAGAVVTDDNELADEIKSLSKNGNKGNFVYNGIGENGKIDSFACSILNINIEMVNGWLARRKAIAEYYDAELRKIPSIELIQRNAIQTNNKYSFLVNSEEERDRLINCLSEREIDAGIYYPVPLNRQSVFNSFSDFTMMCPNAENLSKRIVSLPVHHNLEDSDIQYVIEVIKEFFENENSSVCVES